GDGGARALVAVAELRRDDEEDLAADGLADDAGVPALDELPGPGLERQRVAELPRGVEHRPVPQPAGVVGVDVVALLDRLARALDDRGRDELGGRVAGDRLDARRAVLGEGDRGRALGRGDGRAL